MNQFMKSVLSTVVAAAIVANVAVLYQFGERLARIETRLDMLATPMHATK